MKQIEDFDANLAGEEGKTEEAKTRWFQRIKKGILTPSSEKKGNPGRTLVEVPGMQSYHHYIGPQGTGLHLCQMRFPPPHRQPGVLRAPI